MNKKELFIFIIVIVIIIGLIYIFFDSIKLFFKSFSSSNAIKYKEKEDSLKEEISDKTESRFFEMADKIFQAGYSIFNTDEEAIYSVFNSLNSEKDFDKLVYAFGERRIPTGLWLQLGLSGFLQSTLDKDEIDKVNSILKEKNINRKI